MADETAANQEAGEAKAPEAGAAQEGSSEAAQAAAGGGKKRLLMIISAIVAVVGVVVAVGVVMFVGGAEKDAETAAEAIAPTIVDVPEFTVNLLDEQGEGRHFMKIRLALEVARAEDAAAVQGLMPRLQDDWGGFLRQMRVADMQGSAALYRLKEGLSRRAGQSLAPVGVRAVYIRELLVQ